MSLTYTFYIYLLSTLPIQFCIGSFFQLMNFQLSDTDIPHFLLTPSASAGILERYYGKKIIIELQLEDMLAQILIAVGTFTDFTNPVHTTDRFKINSHRDRYHLRTENYTVSLTVAYKFILGIIPHLHSRSLNVITVSPDAASNLIHSFETPGDPSGAYTRVLLSNI